MQATEHAIVWPVTVMVTVPVAVTTVGEINFERLQQEAMQAASSAVSAAVVNVHASVRMTGATGAAVVGVANAGAVMEMLNAPSAPVPPLPYAPVAPLRQPTAGGKRPLAKRKLKRDDNGDVQRRNGGGLPLALRHLVRQEEYLSRSGNAPLPHVPSAVFDTRAPTKSKQTHLEHQVNQLREWATNSNARAWLAVVPEFCNDEDDMDRYNAWHAFRDKLKELHHADMVSSRPDCEWWSPRDHTAL